MTKPREQNPTVLCIGSDALALHFTRLTLSKQGYRVLTAVSGNTGLDMFAAETVHAVVLDQSLDGWEAPLVAGQMRRQRSDIPIIMLADEAALSPDARAMVDKVIPEANGHEFLTGALKAVLQRKSGRGLPTEEAPA